MKLFPHQEKVLSELSNGKILRGGVGSGKSITALSYYLHRELIGDIYIITTAKKRDQLEWEADAAKLGIGTQRDGTVAGVLTVDSWNNIGKYVGIKDAFFIFDEQRLIGSGAWVKSFYKIAKANAWIILSATPGDTWLDYIPVFVANGFYKNKTAFMKEHVIFAPFSRYPKVQGYVGVKKLEALKKEVLIEMPYVSPSDRVYEEILVEHDPEKLKKVANHRWNIYTEEPIKNVSELFSTMRRVVYSDPSRIEALQELMKTHDKIIVFYNFNYELEMLRELYSWEPDFCVAEWNGHKKQPIPNVDKWVYLVQYQAGAEGWNCTETDAMVFFSLTYSYKQYEQAQGRIDRLNTPFLTLYYYSFMSNSLVDRAVKKSLSEKRSFNERVWAEENIANFDEYKQVGYVT